MESKKIHIMLDMAMVLSQKKLFTMYCSIYIIHIFISIQVSQSVIIFIGIAKKDIIGLMILFIIYATHHTNIYIIMPYQLLMPNHKNHK